MTSTTADDRISGLAAFTHQGARVLLVDDEPAVTAGLHRSLRSSFAISTAQSGAEALEIIKNEPPFAVVVTDMRMPGMDGVALLKELREVTPDTVRMLLTGFAEIDSAIAAINDGNVFRFLCKPCAPPTVGQSLKDAVEQYRLVMAERELLEHTLRGSVDALQETLSLANPGAFARSERVKKIVSDLLNQMDSVPNRWEIELAAGLYQVGAVTLPPKVVEKLHRGISLDADEQRLVNLLPSYADRMLLLIPRLEGVRAIIRAQPNWRDYSAPLGTKLLRLAEDYDTLDSRGVEPDIILAQLSAHAVDYTQEAIDAYIKARPQEASERHVEQVNALALEEGMILAADVKTADGLLLVGRGHTVTQSLLERINNFSQSIGLETEKISILIQEATEDAAD